MMRDNLCVKNNCMELIDFYSEFVDENKEKISKLWEDIENDVQRFPADNKKIIEGTHETNILYLINTIERYFLRAIKDLENSREKEIGYLNLLWMVSLGILLETDKENIKRLSEIIKKQNVNDFVIDYLLCASDIGWTQISNNFVEEI